MTRPVIEQTMIVSMNVCVIETIAWATGLVWAAAAAIGALPRPDSFEKTPRATPMRIVSMTAEPAKPPPAAVGVKACRDDEGGHHAVRVHPQHDQRGDDVEDDHHRHEQAGGPADGLDPAEDHDAGRRPP